MRSSVLAIAVVTLLAAGTASAQTPTIRGMVRDAGTGQPIPYALVTTGEGVYACSGIDGSFRIPSSLPSRLRIMAQGYEAITTGVNADLNVAVHLEHSATPFVVIDGEKAEQAQGGATTGTPLIILDGDVIYPRCLSGSSEGQSE